MQIDATGVEIRKMNTNMHL